MNDDPLLRSLRDLPRHPSSRPSDDRTRAQARAAFERAFETGPRGGRLRGALVPAGLASVVGVYLVWAFAAAIAINQ